MIFGVLDDTTGTVVVVGGTVVVVVGGNVVVVVCGNFAVVGGGGGVVVAVVIGGGVALGWVTHAVIATPATDPIASNAILRNRSNFDTSWLMAVS